jgi:hypothetical protein
VPVRKESGGRSLRGWHQRLQVGLICDTALLNEGGTLASPSDERSGLWEAASSLSLG